MGSYVSRTARFKSGEDSAVKVLQECLARVDEVEPAVQAFVHLNRERALTEAEASEARWREGKALSPVDGMPIGVKDIIETADMPTGQGSPLWTDFETRRDAASVQALRQAGAIVLGKTTTTEFASTEQNAPTTNPHDASRTPGGSSSGSAAAVGAGMVPAALGSQVVGSTIRPASYCGCFGFKCTVGALNRGGSYDYLSQSSVGIIGAALEDVWAVATAIAERVGGDPGHPALEGPTLLPEPRKPRRLAILETAGRKSASKGAITRFDAAVARLKEAGVEVDSRLDKQLLDRFEPMIEDALDLTWEIMSWELRWPLGTYTERDASGVSDAMKGRLADAEKMTLADYRKAIARRAEIRRRFAELAGPYDGFIALAATGAAPAGLSWTGDPSMNVPASLLGVPAVTLPVLEDEKLPLGLQLLGPHDHDAELMALARWIWLKS